MIEYQMCLGGNSDKSFMLGYSRVIQDVFAYGNDTNKTKQKSKIKTTKMFSGLGFLCLMGYQPLQMFSVF